MKQAGEYATFEICTAMSFRRGKMHQNSIIYKTYGGIGIDQKFVSECGINVNLRRNGGMVDPGKLPLY